MADGLSRTLFWNEDCTPDPDVLEAYKQLSEEGPKWMWKDGKNGYKAFLNKLGPQDRQEVLEHGSITGVSVFATLLETEDSTQGKSSWRNAYLTSKWFGELY